MEILDQIENKVKSAIATISTLQAKVKELEDEKAQYQSKLAEMLNDLQMVDEEIEEPISYQTVASTDAVAEQAPAPTQTNTEAATTNAEATTTTFEPAVAQSENPIDEIEEVRSQQAVAPNQLGISSGDKNNF